MEWQDEKIKENFVNYVNSYLKNKDVPVLIKTNRNIHIKLDK